MSDSALGFGIIHRELTADLEIRNSPRELGLLLYGIRARCPNFGACDLGLGVGEIRPQYKKQLQKKT